jgi:HK97 family phage major capsid protein
MLKETFYRTAVLEPAEKSTDGAVRLSFASELPVKRSDAKGMFWEVLSHRAGDANLGFLNRNGVVLENHDETKEVGDVVRGSARVEADFKTRADIKIYDGGWITRSQEQPAEIPVSVGYSHLSLIKTEKNGPEGLEIRSYSWRPFEISLLTIKPADDSVGIHRSVTDVSEVDLSKEVTVEEIHKYLTTEQKTRMKILLDPIPAGGGGAATVDVNVLRAEVTKETRTAVSGEFKTRAKEIVAIADTLIKDEGKRDSGKMADKIRAMANEAMLSDESIAEFQNRCLTEVLKAKPVDPVYVEDCTDEAGQRNYSLLRGIQDCITNERKTPGGLEGEVHQEYMKQTKTRNGGLGFNPQGAFLVPMHRKASASNLSRSEKSRMTRDMQATVFPSGGAVVPTILMTPIIELLRNRMVLSEAGVTTLGGLSGNVVIPRQEAAATAYSVSEIGQLTNSQQVLGQIALTPKRVGATEQYSKQLIMQSSPDIEAFIRDDLFKVIALRWDYLGIAGQGALSEPLGILNTPGVGSVTFGATPTYIKLIAFRTAIRKLNVMDPLTWLSTSAVQGALSGIAEALTGATTIGGSQNAIWKPDNKVVGMPAIDSQQIPLDLVILGAFSQLIQALWGGLDVVVDYWTLADKAEIKLTINTWGDFAVRHPQAFCISTDSGTQ